MPFNTIAVWVGTILCLCHVMTTNVKELDVIEALKSSSVFSVSGLTIQGDSQIFDFGYFGILPSFFCFFTTWLGKKALSIMAQVRNPPAGNECDSHKKHIP
jgi:hypothetical protein